MQQNPANRSVVHVVDDELAVRDSLCLLLQSMGYDSYAWADGEAILAALDEARPGCVLVDLRMMRMDGLQVLQRIRDRTDFPAIMISAHAESSIPAIAIRGGAQDFLRKPFPQNILREALETVFSRQQATIQTQALYHDALDRLSLLDAEEFAVLDQLATGMTRRMTAEILGMSLDRLEVMRSKVIEKLNVPRFARALRFLEDSRNPTA